MRRVTPLVAAAAAIFSSSCDGPKAGEVVAELTSSASNIGAIMFTVVATEPQTVDTVTAACSGCQVFMVRLTATEIRGVLTGQVVPGPALRLAVSDIGRPEAYQVQIRQMARRDYGLQSTSGTRLAVPVGP